METWNRNIGTHQRGLYQCDLLPATFEGWEMSCRDKWWGARASTNAPSFHCFVPEGHQFVSWYWWHKNVLHISLIYNFCRYIIVLNRVDFLDGSWHWIFLPLCSITLRNTALYLFDIIIILKYVILLPSNASRYLLDNQLLMNTGIHYHHAGLIKIQTD